MEMKEDAWEAELEQIVTQYTDMLFRISYSMCGIAADAEDILQNVFLKLCVKRPHFRDDAHCRAWLIRVTINETKNALRFRAVRREEDIAPLITGFDIFTKGDSGSVAVYLENPDAAVLEPVHDASRCLSWAAKAWSGTSTRRRPARDSRTPSRSTCALRMAGRCPVA